jgi:hypothetical protein
MNGYETNVRVIIGPDTKDLVDKSLSHVSNATKVHLDFFEPLQTLRQTLGF